MKIYNDPYGVEWGTKGRGFESNGSGSVVGLWGIQRELVPNGRQQSEPWYAIVRIIYIGFLGESGRQSSWYAGLCLNLRRLFCLDNVLIKAREDPASNVVTGQRDSRK